MKRLGHFDLSEENETLVSLTYRYVGVHYTTCKANTSWLAGEDGKGAEEERIVGCLVKYLLLFCYFNLDIRLVLSFFV